MNSDKEKIEKLNGNSSDVLGERAEFFRKHFPEALTEGQVDCQKLKQALGENGVAEGERYNFTWAGKNNVFDAISRQTTRTLRPEKAESVNFEESENVFIEGENLEVLKILQKSYYGKVKMIYIDPPYNTGNDFVYRDNFRQTQQEEAEAAENIDEAGNLKSSGLHKNSKTGRYHSNWLNMMYPRLFLARNLLRDDGVIFISIDDNEVHNLRMIMNEIFGEENFVGKISWLKKRKGSFLTNKTVSMTEYVFIYEKKDCVRLHGGKPDDSESQPLIKRTNSQKKLNFPAYEVRSKLDDGIYESGTYGNGSSSVELINEIEIADGVIITDFSLRGPFIWTQENLSKQIEKGAEIIINTINFQPRAYKVQEKDASKGLPSFVQGTDISGTNEDAYEELQEIMGEEQLLDYPKPVNYIKYLIKSATHFEKTAIILDFFAGSATTAHAVMDLNAEDGGNRKCISVQLPEETPEDSEARKAGYENIAQIARERIRRASAKIKEGQKENDGFFAEEFDSGFKAFKLSKSNFKHWQTEELEDVEELQAKLEDAIETKSENAAEFAMLYEIMLKLGLPLTGKIEEKANFYLAGGATAVCLSEDIDESLVETVINEEPDAAVFLEAGFSSDELKANTALQMKNADVEFKVV